MREWVVVYLENCRVDILQNLASKLLSSLLVTVVKIDPPLSTRHVYISRFPDHRRIRLWCGVLYKIQKPKTIKNLVIAVEN
jgi:hypothetical protein